jgi:MATE family multidrug resistance protein
MTLIMFFQFSIGFADVYVAGLMGADVLAAVGYVGQLYFTLMIVANGITVGAVSMVSQAHGAKSPLGVGSIAGHSVVLGLVISGFLTLAAGLYPGVIVRIVGMPAPIRAIAEDFIRIFSLALTPTYLMIITAGVLRASGRVRFAMINSFAAALVNVVGDLALGFGWGPIPELGYKGIAWASAAATTLGMGLSIAWMSRGPARIRLCSLWRPLSPCFKNLIRLGAPSALQQVAWNTGTLVVYFLVGQLGRGDVNALAAMTAGIRIEAFIFLPIFAFNMAAAVMTGNQLGAGRPEAARSGAKATAFLCLMVILAPAAGIFIFAPKISGILTDDPAVLAEMTRYLRINMAQVPFMALGVSLSGALQGAGDTLATMKIIFTGMWLVRIPLIIAMIYVFHTGPVGVWWAMAVSIIVLSALLANRFRGRQWASASVDKRNKTFFWEACVATRPVHPNCRG